MYDEPETGIWNDPARVEIEKAANGFVIKRYHRNGCAMEVARTMKEATKISKRLMEMGNAS